VLVTLATVGVGVIAGRVPGSGKVGIGVTVGALDVAVGGGGVAVTIRVITRGG
jgi:hypothetical protein